MLHEIGSVLWISYYFYSDGPSHKNQDILSRGKRWSCSGETIAQVPIAHWIREKHCARSFLVARSFFHPQAAEKRFWVIPLSRESEAPLTETYHIVPSSSVYWRAFKVKIVWSKSLRTVFLQDVPLCLWKTI